jgi:formate dehydrogenase maturation protein FdhE
VSWSEASAKIYDELVKSGLDPYASELQRSAIIMKYTKENKKTTMERLSACPFCGVEDAVASANPMMGQHYILCCCCEAQGPRAQNKIVAGKLWNRLAVAQR